MYRSRLRAAPRRACALSRSLLLACLSTRESSGYPYSLRIVIRAREKLGFPASMTTVSKSSCLPYFNELEGVHHGASYCLHQTIAEHAAIHLRRHIPSTWSSGSRPARRAMSMSHASDGDIPAREDRTVLALGEPAQRILSGLKIGIVGLGGLGQLVAQQLAHLGVRHLLLLDNDDVHPTNLNRLVGSTPHSIGRRKVDVAADMIAAIRHDAIVQAHHGDVRTESDARLLLQRDLILCCTDSHGSRAVLNQLAHQYFVPVLDMGVRIDAPDVQITAVAGRVQLLSPGDLRGLNLVLLDPEQVRRDLLSYDERAHDPYVVGTAMGTTCGDFYQLNGRVTGSLMLLAVSCGFPGLDVTNCTYDKVEQVRNVSVTAFRMLRLRRTQRLAEVTVGNAVAFGLSSVERRTVLWWGTDPHLNAYSVSLSNAEIVLVATKLYYIPWRSRRPRRSDPLFDQQGCHRRLRSCPTTPCADCRYRRGHHHNHCLHRGDNHGVRTIGGRLEVALSTGALRRT